MNTYIPLPNSSAGSPVQFSEPAAYSYESCHCCPRNCQINRTKKQGWCHSPAGIRAARAALHPWEEPCISGLHGSGTIFFSGCTLRCCFCQNYQISIEVFGKDISGTRLEEISGTAGTGRAQYQSGDADAVPSVATARLKTGQTAAFHPDRLQLRRL